MNDKFKRHLYFRLLGGHHSVPKFLRRTAFLPFEEPDKMLRMLEPQRFGNLLDGSRRVEHPLLGYGNHLQLYILLRRLSRFLFHQIPEIIGRKAITLVPSRTK